MRALPWRKVALLAGAPLAVLLLVGIPTLGQDVLEPQGELTQAECYGHHKQEGFRSMDLFPAPLSEVPKGKPFTFQLTVKNPWLADLQDVRAYVNVSDAPGLAFPGARAPDEKPLPAQPTEPTGPGYKTASYPIPVDAGATEVYFSVAGQRTTPLGALTPGRVANQSDYRVVVLAPDGSPVAGQPPPGGDQAQYAPEDAHQLEASAHVDTAALVAHGPGPYVAKVYYGGLDASPYDAFQATYYNASQNTELLLQGPARLGPGESHTFTFQVIAKDVESLQRMRYGGRAVSFHDHHDGGRTENAGDYDKYGTVEFRTGAALSLGGTLDTSGTAVSLLEPTLRRWGQVLGFASSFLIIPSLVFGGTFGRGSVSALNKWFGGPRRRVLFHNSMSFWLLAVASLHMLLFFYEAFWVWSAGLVWGGLALASMVGLGVTGATQRGFVARWGFNRWRYVHFAMGILVVVFTLIHMVADGSHFRVVRALFDGVAGTR